MQYNYIGIDQYNQLCRIKAHPRKELMEWLSATHARKMFLDHKDGNSYHIGYVIRGHWIEVFKLSEWKSM